ncbi:putative E3 ubiquitin-protein ligase ariadne-2 [Phytophthora citrophthora]|uniref:E3 ubiquitin-protein ligase ariadne-2 n=1 Tax=Phytophthora citrophthora TaxID=4793 RepID=A0AAD9LIW5_9STRA|nr:putative E3 ubiquitin-protein ligase ariadne-2 [Phytophthora citrophthora]
MEVLPKLDELKELVSFDPVEIFDSDAIDFVDEIDAKTLGDVYALELYREGIRRVDQSVLDEATALSFYAKEEYKLLHPNDEGLDTDSEEDLVFVEVSELESKPPPSCSSCVTPIEDVKARRILTCGHLYCVNCIGTRCRMGVRDRSMVPAHCCKREFPFDYVKEVLSVFELQTYVRYLKEKEWRSLDLESDREYAVVVRQHHAVQCPGCGVGVQKSSGCNHMRCLNGHEFCIVCARKWKTCTCVG